MSSGWALLGFWSRRVRSALYLYFFRLVGEAPAPERAQHQVKLFYGRECRKGCRKILLRLSNESVLKLLHVIEPQYPYASLQLEPDGVGLGQVPGGLFTKLENQRIQFGNLNRKFICGR